MRPVRCGGRWPGKAWTTRIRAGGSKSSPARRAEPLGDEADRPYGGERAAPARGQNLALAKAYPFTSPPRSLVWCERGEFLFDAAPVDPLGSSPVIRGPERAPAAEALAMVGAHRSTPMEQRRPLIAYGANRSPDRLKEKLGELRGPQSVVPIMRARLTGFDIVFSAHFTSYGAIPATLGYRPGVTIDISVLYVDEQQLALIDASESVGVNYERRTFEDLDLLVDGLGHTAEADAYVSLHGCFDPGEGRALALSAIPAENRDLPAANVVEALNAARQKIAVDVLLDDFIAALAGDPAFRARATKVLSENAIGRPQR